MPETVIPALAMSLPWFVLAFGIKAVCVAKRRLSK